MLFLHKGLMMMFGLGLGRSLGFDQLLEPLGQGDQLELDWRSRRGRWWLVALAVIREHRRVNGVGFSPLALGLSGRAVLVPGSTTETGVLALCNAWTRSRS